MSYIKHTWTDGEVIDAEKLNNIETGIVEAKKAAEQTNMKEVTAIKDGGTGATTRPDAFKNISFIGTNPVESISDDTPENWAKIGGGFALFSDDGLVIGQPSTVGILINYVCFSEVFHIWYSQTSGDMYIRHGNASGWSRTWKKMFDDQMVIPTSNLDIVFSETEPEYAEGRIWLKPIS